MSFQLADADYLATLVNPMDIYTYNIANRIVLPGILPRIADDFKNNTFHPQLIARLARQESAGPARSLG